MAQVRIVTEQLLEGLPEVVQRYILWTGVVGKPWIERAILRQKGAIRQTSEQPFLPLSAKQTFTDKPPTFIWKAVGRMAGLPLMRVCDSYQAGRGRMLGKALGLVTIFDEQGIEMNQGSLMRYLGELIWLPSAFLAENITWREVDVDSAEVSLQDGDLSVSGRFVFDAQGKPIDFICIRYRGLNGIYTPEKWSVPMLDYAEFAGIRIPSRGKVIWKLAEGDFAYYDWEILDVKYP